MNFRIAFHTLKRKSTISRMILFAFTLALLIIISACKVAREPSDEQIEQAKKTVSDIRASLYTPANVVLLAEKLYHGSNNELYPGCVSGHIYLAYYSPQAFDEILEEYRIGLKDGGWEPSPDYSHDSNDGDIFQLGSQTLMDIASFPLREDLLVVPTLTANDHQGKIYFISLTYYDPSIRECSE